MSFIEIIPDGEEFTWSPKTEGGESFESTFRLVKMSKGRRRELTKAHTTRRWHRGQRIEEFDADAFADAVLDEVILDWTGLYVRRNGLREPLPCEQRYKLQLPELIKGQIATVCMGVSFEDAFRGEAEEASDPQISETTLSGSVPGGSSTPVVSSPPRTATSGTKKN